MEKEFAIEYSAIYTGNMFKAAFGDDIKMEFIESIICGGKKCTMTVYLPEKLE
ncbi:MAG: hypothetical protein LBH44_01515 [Treponema sp.]|jgi:hypothetical protein|nr:hypothetical protein [Treponema sp.]